MYEAAASRIRLMLCQFRVLSAGGISWLVGFIELRQQSVSRRLDGLLLFLLAVVVSSGLCSARRYSTSLKAISSLGRSRSFIVAGSLRDLICDRVHSPMTS